LLSLSHARIIQICLWAHAPLAGEASSPSLSAISPLATVTV
jgi:hypothetical protein